MSVESHIESNIESWGRYPKHNHKLETLNWSSDLPEFSGDSYLPYGLGRSYGDSCLNNDGTLILTEKLNSLLSFDPESGILEAEAGVSLADIITFALPQGYFLPVSPGTKFVTLGGAIANDIHGKNHHIGGTFGCFVKEFSLLRSDGELLLCSPQQNSQMFAATIGGLGLTGLILSAKIQLKKVAGPLIDQETIKFKGLEEFFTVSAASKDYEYTVAWLDCVSSGDNFGRGHFIRGNHSQKEEKECFRKKMKLAVPFDLPSFTLNRYTVQAFNTLYYNKQRPKIKKSAINFEPFFYPLDMIHAWNRIYGKNGLLQFQCVLPEGDGNKAIKEILQMVVKSGKASFLAVFKEFGDIPSPGMLSFPRPGATLCLDFVNSQKTRDLLKSLDEIVLKSGGASYPAKDAVMPATSFQAYYPAWRDFLEFKDPKFNSSFWDRVSR